MDRLMHSFFLSLSLSVDSCLDVRFCNLRDGLFIILTVDPHILIVVQLLSNVHFSIERDRGKKEGKKKIYEEPSMIVSTNRRKEGNPARWIQRWMIDKLFFLLLGD